MYIEIVYLLYSLSNLNFVLAQIIRLKSVWRYDCFKKICALQQVSSLKIKLHLFYKNILRVWKYFFRRESRIYKCNIIAIKTIHPNSFFRCLISLKNIHLFYGTFFLMSDEFIRLNNPLYVRTLVKYWMVELIFITCTFCIFNICISSNAYA